MAIEHPERWLAFELSGMNGTYEGEIPQKKCKMDPKPPESNCSETEEYHLKLSQDESGSVTKIETDVRNQEPTDETIKPLEKRKVKELENESTMIIEVGID
ncbi:hypothetical protein O181_122939 [Austropuccinia psidii MF-1]|uniref:Uncharacterized protein n=1 Tax=Austropuccinia psidii MF-1 TaxID=1389203 RepID=A0A9Q3KP23_9BASI|nr:hypothetical protein [Austropuccinia psidii MF-1]